MSEMRSLEVHRSRDGRSFEARDEWRFIWSRVLILHKGIAVAAIRYVEVIGEGGRIILFRASGVDLAAFNAVDHPGMPPEMMCIDLMKQARFAPGIRLVLEQPAGAEVDVSVKVEGWWQP